MQPFQIAGGPGWMDTAQFDIEARAEDRSANPDQVRLMLQTMLEDRFQLKVHGETRPAPVYDLVVAKGSSKIRLNSDQTSPEVNGPAPRDSGPNRGAIRIGAGGLTGNAAPLSLFSRMLSQRLDRLIIDKTNLPGRYDFQLQWSPDPGETARDPLGQPLPPVTDGESRGSIFTAIQEQMGLKLESSRGPVEFLVIDHVEMPSAN